MHPLLVHWPAFPPQHRPYPAVAVARVLPREPDQPAVPILLPALVALAGPGLADHPARPTFGDPQLPPYMLDGRPPPGRAQKLPRLTSFRMLMSSTWSATIFLRRAFSFSNSFRRLVASAF